MPLRKLLLITLLSPFACAASDAPPCPSLPGAAGDLSCVANDVGWFYARDPQAATRIAEDAQQAAEDFQRYFAHSAPRGAIVARGLDMAFSADINQALSDAGAAWQMPWLGAAEKNKLRRSAVEMQLRKQLPQASDAQIAAMLQQAVGKPPSSQAIDRSALRHEIGHMLLIHAFWPDAADQPGGSPHYGGRGPDWLDETAAVLMESSTMANGRRRMLAESGSQQHLTSLGEFFQASHPMAVHIPELLESGGSGGSVRVITGEEAEKLAGGASWFYAQARLAADFLIETSGDPGIFGDIAAFIASGADMADWLAEHGARYGLPSTVQSLDASWRQWLDTRRDELAEVAPASAASEGGARVNAGK